MIEELREDLRAQSSERSQIYRLLSSLYLLELTESQVRNFQNIDLSTITSLDAVMDEGLREIALFFSHSLGKDQRQQLAADYAHSILGVTADQRRMALPYESVFTSPHGLLMQDSRDDVYRLYCQEGLGTPEGRDIPEDHLGLIFEFMACLCDRYNEALSAGNYTEGARLLLVQREMLESHLSGWIDEYAQTLQEVARTAFYRGLGMLTSGWVHFDEANLDNMIIDNEEELSLTGTMDQ